MAIKSASRNAAPRNGEVGAHGTLADAALPGAAFDPNEFGVELSQTSLAEADELLKATMDEVMRVVGGTRAFLALVDLYSGELAHCASRSAKVGRKTFAVCASI